jgi:hypothetical protein
MGTKRTNEEGELNNDGDDEDDGREAGRKVKNVGVAHEPR